MGKCAFKTILIALAGLLPSLVFAAGLGRLTLLSALGEPLRAEIELVSLQPNEGENLRASLAPQEAYRQANVELNGALFDVRFTIEPRQAGQYAVVLTSTRPLNEPFLDILVQLDGASGRLVREYTFLLDPPQYKAGAAVASSAAPIAPPAAQALAREKPAAADAAAARAESPAPAGQASYQVKQGDTLGKIARRSAPEGVSLQQMLVALYRNNQDAFIGSNMNRLRAGRILNIPDREAALSISAEEAQRIVRSQGSAYARYQRSIGAAVAAAPAPEEGTRQASGSITAGAAEKPAAPKQAPQDQVRLSKPDDAKAGGRAAKAAAGDDLAARDKALKEANERVALLEKNVTDLQKLLQLKSAPAAQAQQQAQAAKAPAAEAPKAAASAEAPKAEVPKAEASKAAPEAAKAPADTKAAAPSKAPDVAKAKAPAPKAAPAKAAPESLLDELLANPYALGGLGLVVVLLIGYAAYAWRKKKQGAEQRFGPSYLGEASVAPPSSALGAPGGKSVDTGTSSLQMDFSSGSQGKAQADEIDPVAEADVYMAYGRDAQAEEILKEAIAKDPSRTPVHLKLAEIYANRKDARALEGAVLALKSASGAQGADWDKAVALGRQADPSNPLYGGSPQAAPASPAAGFAAAPAAAAAEASAPAAAAPPLDFDLDIGTGATTATVPDINLEIPAAAELSAVIDFDLDLGSKPANGEAKEAFSPDATVALQLRKAVQPAAAPAPAAAGGGLDFDLGLDTPTVPTAEMQPTPAAADDLHTAETQIPPKPAASEPASIDFDFNLDIPAPAPGAEVPAAPAADVPLDLSAITLDLGEPAAPAAGAPADAKWQEVATKLDLAKAYDEMGDKDGARDLLNEVMQEGDRAQQDQAKSLLAALG